MGQCNRRVCPHQDFPSGPVVEPALQCRRHWFDPWCWKILHAMEQLSTWARTPEPGCCSKRGHRGEKTPNCTWSSSHWPQLEKVLGQQQDPTAAKIS